MVLSIFGSEFLSRDIWLLELFFILLFYIKYSFFNLEILFLLLFCYKYSVFNLDIISFWLFDYIDWFLWLTCDITLFLGVFIIELFWLVLLKEKSWESFLFFLVHSNNLMILFMSSSAFWKNIFNFSFKFLFYWTNFYLFYWISKNLFIYFDRRFGMLQPSD